MGLAETLRGKFMNFRTYDAFSNIYWKDKDDYIMVPKGYEDRDGLIRGAIDSGYVASLEEDIFVRPDAYEWDRAQELIKEYDLGYEESGTVHYLMYTTDGDLNSVRSWCLYRREKLNGVPGDGRNTKGN